MYLLFCNMTCEYKVGPSEMRHYTVLPTKYSFADNGSFIGGGVSPLPRDGHDYTSFWSIYFFECLSSYLKNKRDSKIKLNLPELPFPSPRMISGHDIHVYNSVSPVQLKPFFLPEDCQFSDILSPILDQPL